MPADVLEPGDVPVPLDDEDPVVVVPEAVAVPQFVRPICSECKRPLWMLNGLAVQRDDGSYMHDDARFDVKGMTGSHAATLYVEPAVLWGHLDTKGKSQFSVSQGPSKVRSGWGGGGVA